MADSEEWNLSKRTTKSTSLVCTYNQLINVNPLFGGFTSFNQTYESSTFNTYQFTGQYKITAQGNNVVLTTTSSCSQASLSFVSAIVVFQQKVKPDIRDTTARCKQKVIINENKYLFQVSPFEYHQIDVGTLITASNGILGFTTFKLPSKTNQAKISKALYAYLTNTISNIEVISDSKIITKPTDLGTPNKNQSGGSTTVTVIAPNTKYPINNYVIGAAQASTAANNQSIILSINSTVNTTAVFISWMVKDLNGNTLQPDSPPDIFKLTLNVTYKIGYTYMIPNDNNLYFVYATFTAPIRYDSATITVSS